MSHPYLMHDRVHRERGGSRPAHAARSEMQVCIDPGHGGENTGTQWGGIVEKDWNLEIARMLFAACDPSTGAWMTRFDDVDVPLHERGNISQEMLATLAIVIHVNAMVDSVPFEEGDPNYDSEFPAYRTVAKENFRGALAFCLDRYPDKRIAQRIMDCMPQGLGNFYGKPKIASKNDWTSNAYNCIVTHAAHCPTVLIECGYATSPIDRKILMSDAGKVGIVAALMAGIAEAMALEHAT